jgi:hypothetical protein
MDRALFDSVEREIDDEVKARFPAGLIKQTLLLHHGDDPEIEPGQLWVRVLLPADRREDYEPIIRAFQRDQRATIEGIPSYLAEKLREIRLVEFTFSDNPVSLGGHGPRCHLLVGDRVADVRARGLATTRVDARLGPAGLETVDTLIMAGLADDRAEAIRWVLARFRRQADYELLRERALETGRLRAAHRGGPQTEVDRAVYDVIEREIVDELHKRFPGDVVERAVLLHYGDDPGIQPGDLWVRVFLRADRPEDYDEIHRAFDREHAAAIEEFPRYLSEKLREFWMVEFGFSADPAGHELADGPLDRYEFGQRLADLRAWELGEATMVPARQDPAGLETLDTLILTGIADDRAEAIRLLLADFRQQPEYEQLRQRVREIDQLRAAF